MNSLMSSFLSRALLLVLFPVSFPAAVCAEEKPLSEREKIEALIGVVERLKDASFVRNGREYDAKTAAEFLRGKWKSNAKTIKTARDFIDQAASQSSTTGKPYLIRFRDGTETKSHDWLLKELRRLENDADSNESS